MVYRKSNAKDVLAKTIKMLVRENVQVTFRGVTPMVLSDKDGKVVRVNMPELPDDIPQILKDCLQGYVDHECGHVFYTDFKAIVGLKSRMKIMSNIVEDIRLEKLLPRDLPGTKDNLERMYPNWLDMMIKPNILKALATGERSSIASALLVPGLRGLAGQKAFHRYMTDNNLWPYLDFLLQAIPDLSARLSQMETHDDVLELSQAILDAMQNTPVPQAPQHQDDAAQDEQETSDDDGASDFEHDAESESDNTSSKEDADGADDNGDEGEADDNGDEGAVGDSSTQDDSTDNGADDNGDSEDEDTGGDPSEDSTNTSQSPTSTDDNGKSNSTLQQAINTLNPLERRVLFLYNKKNKTVEEISQVINETLDTTESILKSARDKFASAILED